MPEATIKTDFGDIRITYTDADDLNKVLRELEEQAKIISQSVKHLIQVPPRPVKPGYEKSYRFSSNGKLELLIFPSALVQRAVFALFAYFPDLVSVAELEQVTAIDDIVGKALGQTKNKKYFRKVGDTYSLSSEGITLFMEKVKPLLQTEASSEVPHPDGKE